MPARRIEVLPRPDWPNRIVSELALHAARQLGDLLVAAVEIGARLLGERVEAQPGMLGVDRRFAHCCCQEVPRWPCFQSWRGGEQILQAAREFGRDFSTRQAREMQRLESLRHLRDGGVRLVDAHRQDEQRALGDVARAVDGVAPLAAEISLEPALRGRRDDRHEIGAAGDVALDLAIVVVAALEALQVEPGRDAAGVEAGLEFLHGGQILARVADEDRVAPASRAPAAGSAAQAEPRSMTSPGLWRTVQRRCSSSTNFSAPL